MLRAELFPEQSSHTMEQAAPPLFLPAVLATTRVTSAGCSPQSAYKRPFSAAYDRAMIGLTSAMRAPRPNKLEAPTMAVDTSGVKIWLLALAALTHH